jgi:3-oxoacyl-[acyl-carrier protein] reductase
MPRRSEIPASVALVTGASRGIGRAVAIGLGGAGYRVAVNYRLTTTEALETVRAIEATGVAASAHQADVRDGKAVHRMVADIMAQWGQLDVVVCNAALTTNELLVRVTEPDWDRIVETILTGTFHCLQAAAPVMQGQRSGCIILLGSLAGFRGRTGQAAYAAAKAGLLGLMKSAAREWGEEGICINMILPGWHPTGLTDFQPDPSVPPIAPTLGHGTTLDAVASFAVSLATMRDVSGQIFTLDSRIASL